MLSHQSADAFQMQNSHSRRTYDHRIQEAVCESGDRDLFPELEIPRSTIRSWIHRGIPNVLTCDSTAGDRADLLAEIHRHQRRTALLGAIVGLLIPMLRVSKVRLDYERLPEGDTKKVLLRALGRAGKVLSLSAVLRITQLSSSRYHDWCFADAGCDLDDQSSCPRVVPTRLTPSELEAIQEMIESDHHRHMSLRGLALHAQRIGKIFASAAERLAKSCAKPRLS
jgi:putative transposase